MNIQSRLGTHIVVKIDIQSISDVITNSSSELFCRIESNDLYPIYELLKNVFTGDDPETQPEVYWIDSSNEDSSTIDFSDERPCPRVEIWIPYDYSNLTTFFEVGITTLLNQKFGSDTYTITFD